MKKILVLGAGLSASSLISYLLTHSEGENWHVTVGDLNEDLARSKVGDHPRGRAIKFDLNNGTQREQEVRDADLVVSLLPAFLHAAVGKECLKSNTHLVTASYVNEDMKALHDDAKKAGLIFLNESGLDPGIDHMSAMEVIDEIREKGGKFKAFFSDCGALVAPEALNEWGYKVTWAPRNIVLAGVEAARYQEKNQIKYVPYNRIFRFTRKIDFPELGQWDSYPNRDSLPYRIPYQLEDIPTIYRGTLRAPGFCEFWNAMVYIGLTDDRYQVANKQDFTWRDLMYCYIPEPNGKTDRQVIAQFLSKTEDHPLIDKIFNLGLFSDEKIGLYNVSPARIIQKKIEEKWKFEKTDRDMIIMQHRFEYSLNGEDRVRFSSMVCYGEAGGETAISKTVGWPAAIAVKLILAGKVSKTGVLIPTFKELYEPILEELQDFGVVFKHEDKLLEETV